MSDPVEARLADMRDRSEKATEGRWEYGGVEWVADGSVDGHMAYPVFSHDGHEISHDSIEEDAEFIAHARTDLDDLRGAVEDVLALAEEWDAIPDQVLVRRAATIRLRRAITARLGGA
jgi:hypothetical protein